MSGAASRGAGRRMPHAVVMMLLIIAGVVALTSATT
jgi:hypothetical protein